jgi:glycosyltransferase involved in cell wall biosynthesis
MKLCLVSQEYPPETGGGGIGTQTYLKAHGLAERGHQVHVISSTYTGADQTYQDNQVIVHRVQNPAAETHFSELSVQWVGYSWAVAKKIYALLDETQFDLIEFPEYGAEGFIYQMEAYQYHHLPIAVMLHGSLAMFAERIGWPTVESETYRFGTFMEDAVVSRAHLLLAASRNIAKFWATRRNIALDQIVVIHTAVDSALFTPVKAKTNHRPTILYVGRIDGAKGVLAIGEAVIRLREKYPDILFRLVGAGDETNLRRLHELIEGGRAERHFELVGYVPHQELAKYYAACDLFASPAAQEHGVASVYLEALSCGKPVVACNSGGAPEAVIDGQTGLLVPPDDIEALTETLDRLIADPELRERLGRNGRQLVLDYFSRDRMIDRVEAAYQRLLTDFGEQPCSP